MLNRAHLLHWVSVFVNIISKHNGAFVSSWQEFTNSISIQVEACICSHSRIAIATSWLLWNWYTLRYYLSGPNGFLHFCCVHICLDALGQPVRTSSWMSVSPFSKILHHFLTCSALVTSLSYTVSFCGEAWLTHLKQITVQLSSWDKASYVLAIVLYHLCRKR